jgi:tetratricopeptide (TPR) repeat protein
MMTASQPPATPPEVVQAIAPDRAAALLMESGDFADARKLLLHLEAKKYKPSEVEFLLGMLDMQSRSYASAAKRFRRILISEPKAVRVRLELARALFAQGDYQNAEHQFRLARAGKLPPEAIANIDRYLIAIRRLKRYSYNFALAVAGDTNLNAGPALESVTLYGLPFQLSAEAKQQGGAGVALDAGGEWAQPLSQTVKFRFGAQLDRSQYARTEFDDMSISVHAGPRLTLNRWDFNALATVSERWFGDRPYFRSLGGGLDGTYYISSRTGVSVGVNYNDVAYPDYSYQTGPLVSASWGVFTAPTTSSLVSATAVLSRTDADNAGYANWAQQLGVSYSEDLKGGITVALSPSFTRISYDAEVAAFGVRRLDKLLILQAAVLDRALDIRGFTPRLIYSFSRNQSDVALYSFTRNRVEIGLTRFF